jgi:uncharacterized protein
MPSLSTAQWLLAIAGALGMGISKAGFPGMSLVHVVIFAFIFGARTSTGIILPMLIAADVWAVRAFRQHAQWIYIRRMLPAALVGVLLGFALMGRLDESLFSPLIGTIVLLLILMQVVRMAWPGLFADVPHSRVRCDDHGGERRRPDLRALRAVGRAAEVRACRHGRVVLHDHESRESAAQRRARPD